MRTAGNWDLVKLQNVAEFKTGKLNSNAAVENGEYPFFTCSRETFRINTWSFDCECVLLAGNNANAEYPVKYFKGKFDAYQRTYVITTKDINTLNIRYLYYGIELKLNLLKSLSTGSATRFITKGIIDNLEFNLPKINEQNKIVGVLSAYDNLIENNNRRIAILEDMAQSLYKEWFVKFRFPGYQNTKLKKSSLGLIPEGWEVKSLKDVCNLTMGQSPKSEFYNEKENGMPFFQGVRDYGVRFPVERVWCTKPTRYAKKNDILFSVRAPVGRLNIAGFDLSIGRGLCAINHKKGYQSLLFQQLKSIFTSEDMMGNGAIFNSVTKADMEGIKLISPPEEIAKFSENKLSSIFRSLDLLSLKNSNLKQQRDLLLPKLISGHFTL